MSENICYDRPFLKEVVVRVDFSSLLPGVAESIPSSLSKLALARFPIAEPRPTITQEVTLTGDRLEGKRTQETEWNYWGIEREKRLAIGQGAIFETTSRYASFESLKGDLLPILEGLQKLFPDVQASRVGLRYINHLEPTLDDPLDWVKFVNPGLLGTINHFRHTGRLTRAYSVFGLKFDAVDLKFQFGMLNQDFPALIRKPSFVLDLDAFRVGLQDVPEVVATLDNAHDHIQRLFEDSITADLREVMGAR